MCGPVWLCRRLQVASWTTISSLIYENTTIVNQIGIFRRRTHIAVWHDTSFQGNPQVLNWIYIFITDTNVVVITIVSPLPSSSLMWNLTIVKSEPHLLLPRLRAEEGWSERNCQPLQVPTNKKDPYKWTSLSVLKPIDKWSIIIFTSNISLLIPSSNLWLTNNYWFHPTSLNAVIWKR